MEEWSEEHGVSVTYGEFNPVIYCGREQSSFSSLCDERKSQAS